MPLLSALVSTLERLPRSWRSARGIMLMAGAVLGLVVFAALADAALEADDIARLDPVVTDWAVAARTGALTRLAWTVTNLAGTIGMTALTVAAVILLLGRRLVRHAVVLAATVISSEALTMLLKLVFARQRPSTDLLLGAPSLTYAFPSGHSLNSLVLAGTLAGFVVLSPASRRRKVAATVAAVLVAALVGLSRIYLAYHWMTDVLAGWALGAAWLCLAALVTMAVQERRRGRLLDRGESRTDDGTGDATTR